MLNILNLIDWSYESFGRTCRRKHISGTISKYSVGVTTLFCEARKINRVEKGSVVLTGLWAGEQSQISSIRFCKIETFTLICDLNKHSSDSV